MLSCEYYEIFKNTKFEEQLRTPASAITIEDLTFELLHHVLTKIFIQL